MFELKLPQILINGVSKGGQETSIHIPNVNAIFDAGKYLNAPCVNYFITHPHGDHIQCFMELIIKRMRAKIGLPKIYVPYGLENYFNNLILSLFRKKIENYSVIPIDLNSSIETKDNIFISPVKNFHIERPGLSFGYIAFHKVEKLKEEFINKRTDELVFLKFKGTKLTESKKIPYFCFSGDSRIEFLDNENVRKCKILMHEVTIWDDNIPVEETRFNGHTHVNEMIKECEKFEGNHLVLCHRSGRYTREFALKVIEEKFPSSMKNKIVLFD